MIFLFLLSIVASLPQDDRVDNSKFSFTYNYPWFSGYIPVKNGKIHYVFFQSQNKPQKDPIIVWFNGGPGCSSLLGMINQNGPFVIIQNSTTINQYAWNKNANLLYVQSPDGVGFSQSFSQSYNDQSVAKQNLDILLEFYIKFPEFRSHNLYLSGHGYAGIYIPYLAKVIIDFNNEQTVLNKIKLMGILIGNGCTHPNECYIPGRYQNSFYTYNFLFNHYFYDPLIFQNFQKECSEIYTTQACINEQNNLFKKFNETKTPIHNIYKNCYQQSIDQDIPFFYRIGTQNPRTTCEDIKGLYAFLNDQTNQEILHVDKKTWELCNSTLHNNYISSNNGSYWIYPILLNKFIKWIYSGDLDAHVPIFGTKLWIEKLRKQFRMSTSQIWRPWKINDVLGGYTLAQENLRFLSVRGAGHFVPRDQPVMAFKIIQSFLGYDTI